MKTSRKIKQIAISLVTLLFAFVLMTSYSCAQSSFLDAGVSWIVSNQNPDGSWGREVEFMILDTSIVADTLQALNTSDIAYSDSVTWLNSQAPVLTDYISRKVLSLYIAGY